jgi:hypothetical protein
MKGLITINTDAGFYPIEKVGSYAYWIKGDNIFFRGSGIFKSNCTSPLDAEMKSIINALHILESSNCIVEKIIINRDNIYAASGRQTELQRKMGIIIKRIKLRSIEPTHKNYTGRYVEFRHVKAHSHTENPRHWVNDWCDKQCKAELRNYKQQLNKEQDVPVSDTTLSAEEQKAD